MREDMDKVLVERPRRGKANDAGAVRRRNDLDGPKQLGMRAGLGRPWLNENLSPLRRFLRAQVGRPWDKVYSEIAACIDRRNTVQQHIYQHLRDFIATQVEVRDGHVVDLKSRGLFLASGIGIRQELYVDPRTGLIRRNKAYRSWPQIHAERRAAAQAEIDARRRIVDERTQLHLLCGEWFEVRVAPLPEERVVDVHMKGKWVRKRVAETRFDVVLKRATSRIDFDDRVRLYGSAELYAAFKRQLSRREKQAHRLP